MDDPAEKPKKLALACAFDFGVDWHRILQRLAEWKCLAVAKEVIVRH